MNAEKANKLCRSQCILEIRKHWVDKAAKVHELQIRLTGGSTLRLSATGFEGDDRIYIDLIEN